MKLFKKLLPLSALSTIAVAAPITTSCSKLSAYSWTFLGEAEEPEWRTQPLGGKMDEDGAENTYFNSISKNPEIFAEDVMYHRYHLEDDTNEDDEATTVTITVGKINKTKKTISYEVAIKGQTTEGFKEIAYQEKVICENMPFRIKYNNETKWNLIFPSPDAEDLKKDNNWSLSVYENFPHKEILIKLNSKTLSLAIPDDIEVAFSKIGIKNIRYLSETECEKK